MKYYRGGQGFNPVMLKLAMDIRECTVQHLAQATDIPLSSLENVLQGEKPPEGNFLRAVAQHLEFPPAFFCREGQVYPPTHCSRHFDEDGFEFD